MQIGAHRGITVLWESTIPYSNTIRGRMWGSPPRLLARVRFTAGAGGEQASKTRLDAPAPPVGDLTLSLARLVTAPVIFCPEGRQDVERLEPQSLSINMSNRLRHTRHFQHELLPPTQLELRRSHLSEDQPTFSFFWPLQRLGSSQRNFF